MRCGDAECDGFCLECGGMVVLSDGDQECGCAQPFGDPHGCAVLGADEAIEDVVENAVLCDCGCHWEEL